MEQMPDCDKEWVKEELETQVVDLLKEHGFTLTTAESCTAGLLAGRVMNVAGASNVFNEGYITYSNEAKHRILGVKEETLETLGAVSHETAAQMAEGAAKAAAAQTALSVTGIAGPGGGTAEKPVGLVYIGCYVKGKVHTQEFHFHGNRAQNRQNAVEQALYMLQKALSELEV